MDIIVKYVLFRFEELNVCVANVVVFLLTATVNPLDVSKRTATESVHTVDDDIVFGIDTESDELLLGKLRCCILGSPEILLNVADACADHESRSLGNPVKYVVIVDKFFGIDARVPVVSNGCLLANAVDV
jgi:hypothetical protein